MSVLKAEAVTKSYGGRRVVNGISLEVKGGEVVGLLGPNGAGKTTTFHMMVGLVRPDDGRVSMNPPPRCEGRRGRARRPASVICPKSPLSSGG